MSGQMLQIIQNIRAQELQSEDLQKEGKYIECLDLLEDILNQKRTYIPEDKDEYLKTAERICELCNLIAMVFLQKEKFDECLDYLKRAEKLSHNFLTFKAITMNNLACFYRRTGKLRSANQYLEQAIQLEIKLDNKINLQHMNINQKNQNQSQTMKEEKEMQQNNSLADTHLNLCAVLSQLKKHDKALEHALMSITLLQDEFINYFKKNKEDYDNAVPQDRAAVLTIAYHNLGAEFEHLQRYEESLKTYEKALNFGRRYLNEEHPLLDTLQNVIEQVERQIQLKEQAQILNQKKKYIKNNNRM